MKWIMRVIVFVIGISALLSSVYALENSDKYFGRYKYLSKEQLYTDNMDNDYSQYVRAAELMNHPKSAFYGTIVNYESETY